MSNIDDKNLSQTGPKIKETIACTLIPEPLSYLSYFSHEERGLPGIDGDNAYRQGAHEVQDDR